MLAKLMNIGRNSLRRRNFGVMAGKVMVRLRERGTTDSAQVLDWCRRHAVSYEDYAASLDESLWRETQEVCRGLESAARMRLAALGLDLGGGGHYPLLYFMARYHRARTVLETGVAAGWSSQALLLALEKNRQGGTLWSSDFPYFRYANPEKYVGYVVEERLKRDWKLFIDGDRNNLPRILSTCSAIDLFHYDSDKSIDGRAYAWESVRPRLSSRAVVMFDDIQDNEHFINLVHDQNLPFRVFGFEGKYLGLIEGVINR